MPEKDPEVAAGGLKVITTGPELVVVAGAWIWAAVAGELNPLKLTE